MRAGFDYLRDRQGKFEPKTPSSAIKAFEARLLPIEAFINMGTSIKPLDEEPYDLDEIERVLAREDLDIETNLLLMRLFERMIKVEDVEIALFAAESINLIENRYNKKIEAVKKEQDDSSTAALAALSRLYYELAQLHESAASIKNFYLREAHAHLVRLIKNGNPGKKDVGRLINIFIQFGKYENALKILKHYGDEKDTYFLWLKAELEFKKRNYIGIFQICTWLMQREDQLDSGERRLLAYWLGH